MLLTKKEIQTLKELVPDVEALVKAASSCAQSTLPALLEASCTVGVPFEYEEKFRQLRSNENPDGESLRETAARMLDAIKENIRLAEEGKLIIV